MKEFLKYYFKRPLRDDGNGKMWFTLNHTWMFGSILFIGLFLLGWQKYEAPIFLILSLIPFLLLVYNIIDEYNAFLFEKTGARKVSAARLAYIFYGACAFILFTVILIVILL
jgi:hypothetical protein